MKLGPVMLGPGIPLRLELPFNALSRGNIVSDPSEVTSQALVSFDRVEVCSTFPEAAEGNES